MSTALVVISAVGGAAAVVAAVVGVYGIWRDQPKLEVLAHAGYALDGAGTRLVTIDIRNPGRYREVVTGADS